MESLLINIERTQGVIIPYEYNYYLSIAVYSKLKLYEKEIKALHTSSQPGIHTISNIISESSVKTSHGLNGLDIPGGFFIFRSIDNLSTSYLRLGISMDPTIRIGDVLYTVKSIKTPKTIEWNKEDVSFKSLSPVVVRNFAEQKLFVNESESVEENLNKVSRWNLLKYYGFSEETLKNFRIIITRTRKKTVKISNSKEKESITTGFELVGRITGPAEAIKTLYFKGLGSKTALGLGCWEVL